MFDFYDRPEYSILRFNPKRIFNGYLFVGVGLNHAFDNDEANALDTKTYQMEYLWQGSKNLVAGRLGLGCDLRLNDRLSINIEVTLICFLISLTQRKPVIVTGRLMLL